MAVMFISYLQTRINKRS